MKKSLFIVFSLVCFLFSSPTEAADEEWFPLDQEETLLVDLGSIQKRFDPTNPSDSSVVYRFYVKRFNLTQDVTPNLRRPYDYLILLMEVDFTTQQFALKNARYFDYWQGRETRIERNILRGEEADWRPLIPGETNFFISDRMKQIVDDNQEDILENNTYRP